jgi:uncharacterized protein
MIQPLTCPVCGKVVPPATDPAASESPFCSRRCKQIDFFRWSEGRYAIVESLDPSRIAELSADIDDPQELPEESAD